MGVEGGLLAAQDHGLRAPEDASELARMAASAANASYAPYSNAPAGVAIALADGTVFAGSYLENVAFNPSLPAFQSAYATMVMAGRELDEIASVVVAQKAGSAIDHFRATLELIGRIAPAVAVERSEIGTV